MNKLGLTRLGRRSVLALAFATAALAAGGVQAAEMIGNCELYGKKGAIPFTPGQAGQLTVEVNLPAPGWWNGDTPDTIKDGYEYCMAANIAHRAGLDKVKVVNVAWDALVAGQTKDFDLALSQISITDERKKVVDFSVPYFSSDIGVMVKTGTTVDSAAMKDAADRRAAGHDRRRFRRQRAQAQDAGQGVPGHALDVHRAAGRPDRRGDDRHRHRARPGRGLERRVRGGRPVFDRRDLRRDLSQGLAQRARSSTRSSRR